MEAQYICRRDAGGTGLKRDVECGKAARGPLVRFGVLHPPALTGLPPSKGELYRRRLAGKKDSTCAGGTGFA